jgi:hypothetical protein
MIADHPAEDPESYPRNIGSLMTRRCDLQNPEDVDVLLRRIEETHRDLNQRGFMLPRRSAILYGMGDAGLPLSDYNRVSALYQLRENASA